MKRTGLCVTILLAMAGCQTQSADSSGSSAPANQPIATPATRGAGLELNPLELRSSPAAAPTQSPPAAASASSTPVAAADTPPAAAPPAVAPRTEQVKAEAGVGIKGQSLKEHSGVLVEPAKAYFRIEQKVVFNVQIPKAMDLFKASEGRNPRSQDEFMVRIINENQIKLPTLPPGHKYVYNAEQGELMVERPAK